uniref:TIGR03067 domain-containing protein n=1 Tax=Desulfovibrio sp. U5L TaxID=596152 RepID=I2Q0Q5_9BACT
MSRPCSLVLALVLGFVLAAVPALAKEKKEKAVADVTGVWKGASDSVAMGKLGHADASDAPKFMHVSFTLTIEKQEGRAFYGTKASDRGKETVVGMVDGAVVTMADDDGTYVGKLTGKNSMIVRYLEAGTNSKVASITRFVRDGAKDEPEAAGQ